MKIARNALPAGISEGDYTLTDEAGTRSYRIIAAAPKGTVFAGTDWNDYLLVQVWTAIGWSPLKTAARIDHVLGLLRG